MNFLFYKVFELQTIPEELRKDYKLGFGCTVLFPVNQNSPIPELRNLSGWLIENGAFDGEEVFLFKK